jgi:hypothetical protein
MQGELECVKSMYLECVDSKCLDALGLVVQSLCQLESRLELVVIMIVTISLLATSVLYVSSDLSCQVRHGTAAMNVPICPSNRLLVTIW